MTEMNADQQALMEKLKKMSPEELREFQKKQCIFCQINEDKVKAKRVYDDQYCFAIMDINPAQTGHVLLLPKEHYAIMPQVPEQELSHLAVVTKKISQAILKGLKVQGTNIFVANGTAAGQRAQHFMIHIIPRRENDIIGLNIPQNEADETAISKVREAIQNKVNEIFGIKKEIVIASKKEEKESEEKEDKTPKTKKSKKKQTKKEGKKNEEKNHNKAEKDEEEVSLDDIAGLF